ncbi:9179_t:CDS:2, partial [Gigaspora rosea]
SADEIQETLLISDVSTPFPFIIDYASRQFDFLPLRNDTNNNDNEYVQENSESLLLPEAHVVEK